MCKTELPFSTWLPIVFRHHTGIIIRNVITSLRLRLNNGKTWAFLKPSDQLTVRCSRDPGFRGRGSTESWGREPGATGAWRLGPGGHWSGYLPTGPTGCGSDSGLDGRLGKRFWLAPKACHFRTVSRTPYRTRMWSTTRQEPSRGLWDCALLADNSVLGIGHHLSRTGVQFRVAMCCWPMGGLQLTTGGVAFDHCAIGTPCFSARPSQFALVWWWLECRAPWALGGWYEYGYPRFEACWAGKLLREAGTRLDESILLITLTDPLRCHRAS